MAPQRIRKPTKIAQNNMASTMEQYNESTEYCYLGGRLVKATPMTYGQYSGCASSLGCTEEHGFCVEYMQENLSDTRATRWFPKAAVERFAQWVVP